ncbi:hypothetical protein RO3G_09918 [Rhizopus delemar RA 99-880]|uniref:Presequence translocated-associated motor subunit PAM17 n=1 Tax=Rhizopus delemar (strain RA 99-880 / ATCC MYA-4621 / FGSC 9543 / NRRL 43880) TaxID=246409 RepID=I1C9S8_RHIO9|nr:hypothetical protein RO3G_09918 [Rhizopus delemar RA 99-880]|eukprot:EIE85208.1 hypothetical protein RO3G_09918 [Rhizopus delemar RA 99-880]
MALLSLKPNLLRHLLVNSNVRHLTTNKVAAQNVIPTWNAYFNLRKKRRTYEIVSYLPCTVIPAFGTFAYFAQMQVDPLTKILGMDPLMAAVVATIGAKNRADARLNSIRNPVPDYYGEKVQSVHGYRSWLRKQREHYRKGVFGGDVNGLED